MEKLKSSQVTDYTLQDLKDVENFLPQKPYNGFVIIPTGELHDSGYPCMKFALCYGIELVGMLGGGSDVVNLNGIGGFGAYPEPFQEAVRTRKIDVVSWSMDILPKSGCVRVFCDHLLETDHIVTSNFQIFARKEKVNGDG